MNTKELDQLANEIEQGFMQRGGWRACRYLLGKLADKVDCTVQATVDQLPKCWRLDDSGKPVRDATVVPQMRVWRLDWQTTLGETVIEVRTDQVRLDGIPRMYFDTELANSYAAAEAARKETE